MLSKRKTQSAQVLDPAQQFAMLCCMRPLRLSVRIAALSAEITEVYEELKEKREFFRQYNHLIHGDMKSSARNEVKQLQRKFNELRAEKRHLESVDRAMADPGEYIRDYQEVRALPSVTMASVRGAEALFSVRASIQYQGSRYDLGDWELVLSFETEQIFARQKRTGRDHPGSVQLLSERIADNSVPDRLLSELRKNGVQRTPHQGDITH